MSAGQHQAAPTGPVRCVTYRRVSTDEQGREGYSLTEQERACRKHAAHQGWDIVEEPGDIQSGQEAARRGYQRVLELARRHEVDVVLVWKLDRFGRDNAEALTQYQALRRLKVRVVSVLEGEPSEFMVAMLFAMARQESRNTSDRVHPIMRARVEQGLWMARPPFGYRMVPGKPGHLMVHEQEAAIVRDLFRRLLAGESAYSLSGWLNTIDLPPDSNLRRYGVYACTKTVRSIVSNMAYIGMVKWNVRRNSKLDGTYKKDAAEVVLVPGAHEAIIDRETFDQVQALFARNVYRNHGNNQKGTFLLTGLLACGVCGHNCWGQYHYLTGPKARRTYSYKCGVRGHVCISGRRVDAFVRAQAARLCMTDADLAAMRALLGRDAAGQPDRDAELRAARARQEERRRRLGLFLADGTMTPEDYKTAIADVARAMATLDRELASLEPRKDTAALLAEADAWVRSVGGDLSAILSAASAEEARDIIAGAVQRVTLYRDADPAITWQPWAAALLEGNETEIRGAR